MAGFLFPCPGYANENINLDAGYLRNNLNTALTSASADNGTAGSLLLLVAAGGGSGTTFSNSTVPAGQYVTGGDTILSADSFNALGGSSGTGGETRNTLTILTSVYTNNSSVTGAYIELCWYPGITLAQYKSGVTPTGGMTFGAYNPKLYNTSQSLAPDMGANWTVPGDGGGTVSLNFFTKDDQGTQAQSEGYGTTFTIVPEPSAFIPLSGGVAVCLSVLRKRKRRVVVC